MEGGLQDANKGKIKGEGKGDVPLTMWREMDQKRDLGHEEETPEWRSKRATTEDEEGDHKRHRHLVQEVATVAGRSRGRSEGRGRGH